MSEGGVEAGYAGPGPPSGGEAALAPVEFFDDGPVGCPLRDDVGGQGKGGLPHARPVSGCVSAIGRVGDETCQALLGQRPLLEGWADRRLGTYAFDPIDGPPLVLQVVGHQVPAARPDNQMMWFDSPPGRLLGRLVTSGGVWGVVEPEDLACADRGADGAQGVHRDRRRGKLPVVPQRPDAKVVGGGLDPGGHDLPQGV